MPQRGATKHDYTFRDMKRTLVAGWGKDGARAADLWHEYTDTYFAGALKPLPIFFTPSSPYGRMVGWTCCATEMTHIALVKPSVGCKLIADRGVLLHEMIHQSLHQHGLYPKHAGKPWRDEIMRLHRQITGKELFAPPQRIIKVKLADGTRESKRVMDDRNAPQGVRLLEQDEIARWPHSCGVDLGSL
jgi:hypothetical protein